MAPMSCKMSSAAMVSARIRDSANATSFFIFLGKENYAGKPLKYYFCFVSVRFLAKGIDYVGLHHLPRLTRIESSVTILPQASVGSKTTFIYGFIFV